MGGEVIYGNSVLLYYRFPYGKIELMEGFFFFKNMNYSRFGCQLCVRTLLVPYYQNFPLSDLIKQLSGGVSSRMYFHGSNHRAASSQLATPGSSGREEGQEMQKSAPCNATSQVIDGSRLASSGLGCS